LPAQSMRWLPLDLDNFTAISQEVDDVVNKYKDLAVEVANNYSNRGAEEALAQLRHSIEQRVEDLENFYYENDMDERAILFEKQRLKLKKVLVKAAELQESIANGEYFPEEEAPPQSQQRRAPSSTSRRPNSASRKDRSNGPSQMMHSNASSKKSRVAPIYDWEVRKTKKPDQADNSSQDAKCFEFQVKLSPEEYEELMERRADAGARGRSFLQKGAGHTMSTVRKQRIEDEEESKYITSSGPYIEPTYFESWRSTNKNKWVAKTDFNTAARDDGSGSEFLQEGPYIEGAFKACLRGEDKAKWVGDEFKRNV